MLTSSLPTSPPPPTMQKVPEQLKSDLKSRGVALADDVMPAKVKVVIKGRAAVDVASELADTHHVLEEGGGEEKEESVALVRFLLGMR